MAGPSRAGHGPAPVGIPMGHEFVGVVEEMGGEASTPRPGGLVIAPFAWHL
nr:alcohol dehydrogenase catalytic domain-containing protein [Parafrankia discariae]